MIEVKDLCVKFGEKMILNQLNLNVKKGQLVLILGENGSGKSTLLKTIAGRIKPETGGVTVKKPFVYHQQEFPLLDNMTVEENIKVYTKTLGFKYEKEVLIKLIHKLQLTEFQKLTIEKLSGGQRQRLSLLITMLREQEVFLIDEADAAMDPKGRILFLEQLKRMKELGKTVVFISHHIKESLKIADGCFVLKDGKADYIPRGEISNEIFKYSYEDFVEELERKVC